MLRVYFEALVDYETRDIEAGIHNMLSGRVDGFNPSFLPPAPLVARSVRDAMMQRLDAQRLERLTLPPPADDWVDDPPEVKARNKAKFDELAASLASSMRSEEAENDRKRQQLGNKTNARFAPSYAEADISKRLGIGRARFTVGDEDAEQGDMGQSRGAA